MSAATRPKGVDPTQARDKVQNGRAILVCAEVDEQSCMRVLLDGSITLSQLLATLERRRRDEEIIFYCASPDQATSIRRAEEFRARGWSEARVLIGGVEAWKKTGFPLAAETDPQNPAHG